MNNNKKIKIQSIKKRKWTRNLKISDVFYIVYLVENTKTASYNE